MCLATIDFVKAFDSVSHDSIWKALETSGIEQHYTNLLRRLYTNQEATFMTGEESEIFEIKRRTKQGDPLPSLLINTVLQVALKDDLSRWQKKRNMGICLGDCETDCFTDLRFADDVLLFATSLEQLQKMLCDFNRSTEKVGLKIHPGKTKILGNQSSNKKKEVTIDNIKVEILPKEGSTKYLGQTNTIQ